MVFRGKHISPTTSPPAKCSIYANIKGMTTHSVSLCLCVCLSVCLSVSLSIAPFFFLSLSLSLCVCVSLWLSLWLSLSLYVSVSVSKYTDGQKKRYRLMFANGSNRNVEIWYLLNSNKWITATMLFAGSIIVVFDWRCFMRWRHFLNSI